jgi:hypothetical protein
MTEATQLRMEILAIRRALEEQAAVTEPTQAQIDAAAEAIFTARMLRNDGQWDCHTEAVAALTAAAGEGTIMTEPTQAQIESSALARLCDALLRWHTEQDGNWGYPSFRNEVAAIRDALTAAAGADEKKIDPDAYFESLNRAAHAFDRGYKEGGDTMKERCAQVADGMAYVETCADDTANGTTNAAPYRKVAAAIRALKDEP